MELKRSDIDFIIFALPRWDAIYSSGTYSTAKELARSNRVFYIDHPFTYKDFKNRKNENELVIRKEALTKGKNIFRKVEGAPELFTAVTTPLMTPINFLPDGFIYNFFYGRNDRKVYKTIERIINEHNVKNFIFMNSYDPFYCNTFPDSFKPLLNIYKTSDDISQAEYTARHGVRLENEQAKKADLVIATSIELTKKMLIQNQNSEFFPNAANVELFSTALFEDLPKPKELEGIKTKIIGYSGALSTRLDYELFKKTAEYHKDKTLVLLGSKDNPDYRKVGLEEMDNVVFCGSMKLEKLPAYLKYFDCAIIPFEKTLLTKSIYPLKLNEYLAAGCPVVVTDFAPLPEFESVISIAKNDDEFVRLIDEEIKNDTKDKKLERNKLASGNSWSARVEQLWNIMLKNLKKKNINVT